MSPQDFLYGRDKDAVSELLRSENECHHVNIFSFNYTNLIDKLFPSSGKVGSILGTTIFLDSIFHIHGTLDGTMIMGVNDSSQIENKELVNDDDLMDILIKPQANDAIRSSESVKLFQLMKNADIIVLYGLSISDTDKLWWERIGERLKFNKSLFLLIFDYDTNPVDVIRGQKLGSRIRKVRNDFFSKSRFVSTFNSIC